MRILVIIFMIILINFIVIIVWTLHVKDVSIFSATYVELWTLNEYLREKKAHELKSCASTLYFNNELFESYLKCGNFVDYYEDSAL